MDELVGTTGMSVTAKVKVMSAIDSAALTGARWQQNTLNLIGEMKKELEHDRICGH